MINVKGSNIKKNPEKSSKFAFDFEITCSAKY